MIWTPRNQILAPRVKTSEQANARDALACTNRSDQSSRTLTGRGFGPRRRVATRETVAVTPIRGWVKGEGPMAEPWKSSLRWIATAAVLSGGLMIGASDVRANAKPTAEECKSTPSVIIDGGTMTNTTNVDLSANGGTAIGDASGGNTNVANQGASAGNGGGADAGASGGDISAADIFSGNNVGSAIGVGDTWDTNLCDGIAAVQVSGGEVTNTTTVNVSANGGTAIADASGGDNNVALNGGNAGNGGSGTSSSGNGGLANAAANGGAVSIGNINSGSNSGNVITVGDTIAGGQPPIVPVKPGKPDYNPGKPVCCAEPGKPGKTVIVTPNKGGKQVKALPSTGAGMLFGAADLGSLGLAASTAIAAAASAATALRRRQG